jgi:quercetin dioxygenase-like cupin family protein
MYNSHQELVNNLKVEGVKFKVTQQVDSLLMTELEFQKGALLPEHVHQTDHSGYLLQGRIRMTIDGIPRDLVKGDSWCIVKNLCHSTEALEYSKVIEVYGMEKEDFQDYILDKAMDL